MVRKIVLAEPRVGGTKPASVHARGPATPSHTLGLEYLGAVAQQEGEDVEILYQLNKTEKEFSEEILNENPWLVGFPVLTSQVNSAQTLLKELKKRRAELYTVVGGCHPFQNRNVDYLVYGEGEETFRRLISTLKANGNPREIKGLGYQEDGEFNFNPPRGRIDNLDQLPFPLHSVTIEPAGLRYPASSTDPKLRVVGYSRGCPHACSYCSSPSIWGKQVRWRSAENTVDEMEYFNRERGTNLFGLSDLTFNLNEEKAKRLCDELIGRDLNINLQALCDPKISEELLEKMEEARFSKLSIGVEDLRPDKLRKLRDSRYSQEQVFETLTATNKRGFLTRAYFMIGDYNETREGLEELGEKIKQLPVDEIRMTFLTPFPYTPLYRDYKNRGLLLTEDFDRYTTDEPVINCGLTSDELLEIRGEITKGFYQSKRYRSRIGWKIRKFPHLKQSYEDFLQHLRNKGVLEKK